MIGGVVVLDLDVGEASYPIPISTVVVVLWMVLLRATKIYNFFKLLN